MASFQLSTLEDHTREMKDRSGSCSYTELAPAAQSAPQAPAFLIGAMPEAVARRFYEQTDPGAVRCYLFHNATLATHGIITHQGMTLHSEALNHPEYFVRDFASRIFDKPNRFELRFIDGPAVLLNGPGAVVFGHWLVDFLPRLFVLAQAGFKVQNLKFVVSSSVPGWVHRLLDACGITKDRIILHREYEELLQISELIVPTNVRQRSRVNEFFGLAAADVRCRLETHCSPAQSPVSSSHLFVSRSSGDSSRLLENRAELEDLAVEAGFTVVKPESFTIIQQIALFRDAKIILGEYGSALHLSMFSRRGTVVCAIRGSSHHPAWIQSGIGQTMRQPTGYLLGNTPEEAVDQIFLVQPDSLKLGIELSYLLAENNG